MSTDLEKAVTGAIADGVARSSLLSSALAVKLSDDKDFLVKVVEHLDSEVIARAIAQIIIDSSARNFSNGAARASYIATMQAAREKAAIIVADQMAKELRGI